MCRSPMTNTRTISGYDTVGGAVNSLLSALCAVSIDSVKPTCSDISALGNEVNH